MSEAMTEDDNSHSKFGEKEQNKEYNKERETFRKIVKTLNVEVRELNGKHLYALKTGEGRVANILGMERKNIIKALNWADDNNEEAERIISEETE